MTTADWITIKEYAERFGIHRNTVSKWLKTKGILETWRVGGVIRIKPQPPKETP